MSAPARTPGAEPAAGGGGRLSGNLGVVAVVFMVIAAAAPLTVIGGNVALSISLGNGPGAPAGFLIATVVLLLFSVGFVTMTPHVRQAGAFYAYVGKGLGDRAGVATAFLALVAYTAIQVAVWGYLGGVVRDLVVHYHGPRIGWPFWTAVFLVVVGVLGYRHIDLSARVLGVALVLEILIVLVMDAAIVVRGGHSGLTLAPFAPSRVFSGPLGIAVLFSVTGFIGFEATAVFRDEGTPERTIPRATYLAVLIIGVFYTASSWAMVQAWGVDRVTRAATSDTGGFMLDTAQLYVGTVLRDVMQLLLVSSLFACVLSFHNVVARYQFGLADRKVLPAFLARVHPSHHSPSTSSLVQTATAVVLLAVCALLRLEPLTQVFSIFAGIATLGIVLLMMLTSVAVLVYFTRHPAPEHRGALWTTRVVPVVALVGLAATLWLVLSNFTLVVAGGIGLALALGAVPFLALAAGAVVATRLKTRGVRLLRD